MLAADPAAAARLAQGHSHDPGVIVIASAEQLRRQPYWLATHRPLSGLYFILPLVIAYELALLAMQLGLFGLANPVLAYQLVHDAFSWFGATRLWLPGLAVPIIFLFWHLSTREPWAIRPHVVSGMWMESFLLAVPIFALHGLLAEQLLAAGGTVLTAGSLDVGTWQRLLSSLTLSIGAGIYEELVFRLVLMAIFSMLICDLCCLPRWVGLSVGAVASGLIFSMYHYMGAESYAPHSFYFRWLAGVYLAAIFCLRGFGMAVGTHAAYDILAVLLMAWPQAAREA